MEKEISVIQDRQPRSCHERCVGEVRTLVLFITSPVGCSGEGGIKGDGVRWREAEARQRQSVAGRESPAGVAEDEPRLQPCVFYTCTRGPLRLCLKQADNTDTKHCLFFPTSTSAITHGFKQVVDFKMQKVSGMK